MSEPKDIGGGWTENLDPSSGRKYYSNAATQETSWEWPASVPKPAGSDADWTEVADPTSGRTYYYNSVSGETSWTDPRSTAGAAEESAADWQTKLDEGSGREYYFNVKTNVTQWDKPAILSADAAAKPAEAEAAAAAEPAAAAPAPAPAAAEPAAEPEPTGPSGPRELSAESKKIWLAAYDHLKASATATIQARNNKFGRLRHFGRLKSKKEPAAIPAPASVSAPSSAQGAGVGAGAGAPAAAAAPKSNKTVASMLEVKLPETVDEMSLEEYAEAYFNLNRKGIFNKRTTVAKILNWKADVIKTSLRIMSKDLSSTAVQSHRNITGYMGDRNTKKEGGGHAYKLLTNMLGGSEELRDELYCQLIKQTTNNPKPESNLRGWELFAICAGAFPPSKEFEPYLLHYCNQHADDPDVGKYAKYAMGQAIMSQNLEPRKETPTQIEVEAVKEMKPVIVRVYHLDGTYHNMPVTSWTTPEHLNEMMALRLGIQNPEAFACYEMTPEGEERYLTKDRILDLVAYWQRLFEEEKTKKQKKKENLTHLYRLVYKVHMYFDPQPGDAAATKEMFIQAVFDVVSSRYPCEEADCVQLAALQLQYEVGDEVGKSHLSVDKLKRYLPRKFVKKKGSDNAAIVEKVIAAHEGCKGLSKLEAQTKYLQHVQSWKIYGSSFFFVEPQIAHTDLPDEVFLAVNPKGVLLINPETKDVLAEHPYAEVPTWGHSGSSFVLHIGNLVRQTKIYFHTEQGKEINDLVRAYVKHMCG